MSKILKYGRKIALLIMIVCMTFVLTGCELPAELQASLVTNFTDRADQNKRIADELKNAGIISDDTYNQLVKSIDTNLGKLGEQLEEDNTSMKNLLKACVGWHVAIEDNHQDENGNWEHDTGFVNGDVTQVGNAWDQCSDFAGQFLTNFMGSNSDLDDFANDNVPALGGNNGIVAPIEVISESVVEALNKDLSVPIYALDPNISSSSGNGLDEVMEAIKAASEMEDTTKAEQLISKYFQPVKYIDENGEEKQTTLLDPDSAEEQIVRMTSIDYNVPADYDGTKWTGTLGGGVAACYAPYTGTAEGFPSTTSTEPGIDMVVIMSGRPILAVRLVEFNSKAIENLRQKIGLSNKRYLVLNGRAFLMEYPLGYIDGFKETDDGASYNSVIKRSGLGFNLLTGDFTKYNKDADGNYTNESTVISKEDPYLTYLGASSQLDESQSSLVLYGETGVTGQKGANGQDIDEELNEPFNLSFGGSEENAFTASVGRIVLRDYLEFTYAPEVVSGENIIALGRKLRILQLEGSKNNVVAQFYDKDGQKLGDDSAKLFIDDFADLVGVVENDTVKYISKQGKASSGTSGSTTDPTTTDPTTTDPTTTDPTTTDPTTTDPTTTDPTTNPGLTSGMDTDDKLGIISSSASKIDNMSLETVSQISCSSQFPGEYIAKSDVNLTDQKPLFYGMMVRASIFETGLFSGWVQSTDDTKNSTVWWNKWLGAHGFNYKINTDNLVNFLKGNYATDLSKENIVILDLETIAKIQQEYQAEDKLENAHFIRTIFIVFGYILIAYAIILLIAWNVDINVDLGFNILEKLSFGKWVAVKDYEEMPFMDEGDTKFMKFGTLLVSCIFIIAVGIILIQVNIIDFVLALIQLFGGIASYISQIFTGVY